MHVEGFLGPDSPVREIRKEPTRIESKKRKTRSGNVLYFRTSVPTATLQDLCALVNLQS